MQPNTKSRPLTGEEFKLATWLLTNSELPDTEKTKYLDQLSRAVVAGKCGCGCASIYLEIQNEKKPEGGLTPLCESIVGENEHGLFIYSQEGILSGIEIYTLADQDPRAEFPKIEELRLWKTEPNQSLQTTTMAVTDAAAQPPRQP
jgi:hypothetical protein